MTPTATSITLRAELVVNQNYSPNAYANYRLVEAALPPDCKLHNFVLESAEAETIVPTEVSIPHHRLLLSPRSLPL